jgi:TM2 domain-containing membrane protein YozV
MDDQLRQQLVFESNRKSAGLAYVLWFFLGGFGAHRFYLGQNGTAIAQLLLGILGWLPLFLGWIVLGIWLLVDLFLIPGITRDENMKVIEQLSGNGSRQPPRPSHPQGPASRLPHGDEDPIIGNSRSAQRAREIRDLG